MVTFSNTHTTSLKIPQQSQRTTMVMMMTTTPLNLVHSVNNKKENIKISSTTAHVGV